MAVSDASDRDLVPDPIQDALKIIRGYHAQFIAFKEEQVGFNAKTSEAIEDVRSEIDGVKAAVSESTKSTEAMMGKIVESLEVLKEDKKIREATASALEKSPWGQFKTAFVRAGVVFFVGGIWVLIGWTALSLYNSFKGGPPVATKTEQGVN